MNNPDAFDLFGRGFLVVVFGPFLVALAVVAVPFIALGWLTHRLGWTVEHEEPSPGEW